MKTQKLITMLILLNFVVGIVVTFHNNPTYTDYITTSTSNLNNLTNTLQDDKYTKENSESAIDYQYEKTAGNTISQGSMVMDILWNGIKPWSANPESYDNAVEKVIAIIITLLRSLLGAIIFLEIYFVIKNRKAT